MNIEPKFTVEATLKADCQLEAFIRISDESRAVAVTSYIFFLLCNGKVIDKVYTDKHTYSWTVSSDGIYVVQGYLKGESKSDFRRSQPVEYFTKHTLAQFHNFCNEKRSVSDRHKLALYPQPHPFQDIAIISLRAGSGLHRQKIRSLIGNLTPRSEQLPRIGDRETIVLSTFGLDNDAGRQVCFSGLAHIADEKAIVIGQTELLSRNFSQKLNGATGCFSCVEAGDSEIRLHTDYFGFNRFFYYQTNSEFFASNRYHLLLQLLASCNITLRLDTQKAIANLCSVSSQIMLQNFTRRMDFHGIYQLEQDKDIEITAEGINFVDNSFAAALAADYRFDRAEYENALQDAKAEIIENVSVILNAERFSRAIVDLTGGLDSRLVYSAVTNIEQASDKVRINSRDVPGSADLEIALRLNGLYGYSYDDSPATRDVLTLSESDAMMRSFYMGTYYSHNLMTATLNAPETISVNGACGEILCRPYIARNFYSTSAEGADNLSDFAFELTSRMADQVIVGYDRAYRYFHEIFCEELGRQPVKDHFEAVDRAYLMYRHGYHFDGGISYRHNYLGWMPLQSKQLFALHHRTYTHLRDITIQLDLLHLMNPILAGLPFEDDRDNRDHAALQTKLTYVEARFKNIKIPTSADQTEWASAFTRKKANTLYSSTANRESWEQSEQYIYERLIESFKSLMHVGDGVFRRSVGPALYYYITANRSNKGRMRILYNKIVSLTDQIDMIPNCLDPYAGKKLWQRFSPMSEPMGYHGDRSLF